MGTTVGAFLVKLCRGRAVAEVAQLHTHCKVIRKSFVFLDLIRVQLVKIKINFVSVAYESSVECETCEKERFELDIVTDMQEYIPLDTDQLVEMYIDSVKLIILHMNILLLLLELYFASGQ